jgi:hypothetical protein
VRATSDLKREFECSHTLGPGAKPQEEAIDEGTNNKQNRLECCGDLLIRLKLDFFKDTLGGPKNGPQLRQARGSSRFELFRKLDTGSSKSGA